MLSGKCFHSELAQLFFTNLMYQTKVAPPLTDTFCQQTLPISRFNHVYKLHLRPRRTLVRLQGVLLGPPQCWSCLHRQRIRCICEVPLSDISSHSSAIDQMNILLILRRIFLVTPCRSNAMVSWAAKVWKRKTPQRCYILQTRAEMRMRLDKFSFEGRMIHGISQSYIYLDMNRALSSLR